jgi:hypothetical protein
MSKKSNASKKSLAVNVIGAEAAPMDADLAALLNVLEVPGDTPTLEVIEQANAPLVEAATEIIESADVETLELSEIATALDAAPLLPETPAVIEIPTEVLAGGESDAALDAALATIEVQDSYAQTSVEEGDPTIVPMNDEEAEKERLLAEEELGEEAAAAVAAANGATPAAAPAKARTPRIHYANKTDRIKARLGANLGNYLVLEIADADLEGDALKAKQDETLAVIDAMSVKVKNRASLLLDFLSGKTAKPNEILKRALDVLAADGKITTGDNGNLHKNLIAKPYSPSAARAMGRNTVTVMEKTKMIVAGANKGEFLPNPSSLFLAMANEMTGLSAAAEEPAAEESPVEEPSAA